MTATAGYTVGMQVRLGRNLEACARAATSPLSVDEFLARFPEVPRDLRDEPVLHAYVDALGPQLRVAQKPTPCMGTGGDAEHVFYTRLVNDLAIYGIGLAKRDRTLTRLSATLEPVPQAARDLRLHARPAPRPRHPALRLRLTRRRPKWWQKPGGDRAAAGRSRRRAVLHDRADLRHALARQAQPIEVAALGAEVPP